MGEVNVTINKRSFKLGCDDGEEEHLLALAQHLDKHVENLRKTLGKAGDDQLFLMAGLMVCDELWDARDLLVKANEVLTKHAETTSSAPGDGPKALQGGPSGLVEPPNSPATPVSEGQKAPAQAPAKPLVAPVQKQPQQNVAKKT